MHRHFFDVEAFLEQDIIPAPECVTHCDQGFAGHHVTRIHKMHKVILVSDDVALGSDQNCPLSKPW